MYERQDRRCRWSVAGIERYVVEGEVMEEGGNRSVKFFICLPCGCWVLVFFKEHISVP